MLKEVRLLTRLNNFEFINSCSYGGYGKSSKKLIHFVNEFYKLHDIPLDVVYTGKMMMSILDLVAKDYFRKGSSILAIHTGGLQGNKGMSERLGLNLP